MNSLQEVRFATQYRQSSNMSWKLYLVHYYVVIRSHTCQYCEISKKLTLNPRLSAKNTPLFLFPYMGTRFKYLLKLCPYILIYSALHIHVMQWFLHILDVFTLKIRRKFFDFYILWIKTNVAYTRLAVIARNKVLHSKTTASNWFVALYCKLLPAVSSSSKHGCWRSSLLLYSISMLLIPWTWNQLLYKSCYCVSTLTHTLWHSKACSGDYQKSAYIVHVGQHTGNFHSIGWKLLLCLFTSLYNLRC